MNHQNPACEPVSSLNIHLYSNFHRHLTLVKWTHRLDSLIGFLSDYHSLSIENLGEDARVCVSTVEDNPITYSATHSGVLFTDLQYPVDINIALVME